MDEGGGSEKCTFHAEIYVWSLKPEKWNEKNLTERRFIRSDVSLMLGDL